ncbi:MAG: TRAFAC clade GTPase domain-containing protein [Limisphaerales bacterium]
MRSRYVHLIGILGCTDAGKTCFMSSLYLLAACCELMPRYRFAGSLTLQGFEDRIRRLRRWEAGVLPNKLSDHTVLSDARTPSLLHLALQETVDKGGRLELLLTDLPGEWTTRLINNVEAEKRFRFLHRADGIIVVIEGPSLVADETRHIELFRSKLLLSRLAETLKIDRTTPVVILISKCDKLEKGLPPDVEQLVEHGRSLGFIPEVIRAAAFSSVPEKVANGMGVITAIEHIVRREFLPSASEPISNASGGRSFGRFRI